MYRVLPADTPPFDADLEALIEAVRGKVIKQDTTIVDEAGVKQVARDMLELQAVFEEISPVGFSVDTHLFRELGELLVGRDSTALVELIKNAYDADATRVAVYGVNLDDPERGRITITDDGVGMNARQFRAGFLRVASRFKSEGEPRSPRYNRRYTGAKGIGRLSAHKLARYLAIESVPWGQAQGDTRSISASIDWDAVEALPTLDAVSTSDAMTLVIDDPVTDVSHRPSGTVIALERLRRKWSDRERTRFFAEVTSFTPPDQIVQLPARVLSAPLLFSRPMIQDVTQKDPGFSVRLEGELAAGEDYWASLAQAADWVIEIDATRNETAPNSPIRIGIAPTLHGLREFPNAASRIFSIDREHENDLSFQARILIREGVLGSKEVNRDWLGRSAGIRVYMEGFRVLPYGEQGNDWLSQDFDYARRNKQLTYLRNLPGVGDEVTDEALIILRNTSYFGAVFLTVEGSPGLRMLVNREGFIPNGNYEELVRILRIGTELSVRVRSQSRVESSQKRREERKEKVKEETRQELREKVALSVERASQFASQARQSAAVGDFEGAITLIGRAAGEFDVASESSDRLMTEGSTLRVLASVGAQMAGFVHEINGLLGTAKAVESAFQELVDDRSIERSTRQRLARMQLNLTDLRRSIERQAAYLVDVVSPDARRRRARQKLADRFATAMRLVEPVLTRRNIDVINDIPEGLRTPPMFPAEVTVVFSNLLTNAVKAAGSGGRIRAWGDQTGSQIRIRLENTGASVSDDEGERWFLPFESTTTEVDSYLGQGMGMGLPITRNLLAEYGASIRFATPSPGYAAALEITFP